MDAGFIVRQLRAAGAQAEITDVGVVLEGTIASLKMMRDRPATPSDLRRATGEASSRNHAAATRPIVSAERASPQAVSWALKNPEVTLVLRDQVVLNGVVFRLEETPTATPRRKGPPPYARHATARALLSGAPRKDQARLAELAGVTQGSVSNALRRIPEFRDPGAAFDEYVSEYPGAGGQTYYWWSGRPVSEQAHELAEAGALLSGDFAADRIAPWRMPEHVVAYVSAPVDLSTAGYVLSDAEDFTAIVTFPADVTLWATARTWGGGDGNVVDPIIAAYDVIRTATTGDGDEAVEKLRDAVIERFETARHRG